MGTYLSPWMRASIFENSDSDTATSASWKRIHMNNAGLNLY